LARPHLRQHFLGRDAAVHHPDAFGLLPYCASIFSKKARSVVLSLAKKRFSPSRIREVGLK
jgi:hypothetical protein